MKDVRQRIWCCDVLLDHGLSVLPSALLDTETDDALGFYTKMAHATVRRYVS